LRTIKSKTRLYKIYKKLIYR